MSRIPGVVIGIVRDREDPEGEGRIQVEFPWLEEDQRSAWAPIAAFMAGGDRGAWFMPEIGDEVLVAFEHGDFDHPFVVGFLWNGVDRPPSSDIDADVRRLRTVSGHRVEFDDRVGRERILIHTSGGHEIELADAPTPSVRVTTSGGHELELDDLALQVTLSTTGGQTLRMTDTPPAVSIQTSAGQQVVLSPTGMSVSAPSGSVNLTCLQASINASALLNVTAPLTIFSGVVQAQVLVAPAVVGGSYTPAPGNTFGL
jgi:uncharacterized protein involved in type VI secretion and phage assembly